VATMFCKGIRNKTIRYELTKIGGQTNPKAKPK